MRTILFTIVMALAVVCGSGCATTYLTEGTVSHFGDADPEKDKETLERYLDKVSDQKLAKSIKTEIRVLVDTIPEGLNYHDGNLSVEKGYDHKIIGKFSLGEAGGSPTLINLIVPHGRAFPNYRQTWLDLGLELSLILPQAFHLVI